MINLAAHLEHLETVLKEFDLDIASNKEVLICYFCNGLRSSIRAQTDESNGDLDTWEEGIEKVIDTEAKAAYQPSHQ